MGQMPLSSWLFSCILLVKKMISSIGNLFGEKKMVVSPLAFPELIGLITGMACIGFLLTSLRWVRFERRRREPKGRGVSLRNRDKIGSLLVIVFSWPLLVLALFSFAALGVVSCGVGFYRAAPVPPASTLSLATLDNLLTLNARNGTVLQTHSWGDDTKFIATNPTEANGVIYFGMDGPMYGEEVTIRAYRPGSGTPLWSTSLGKASARAPGDLLVMLDHQPPVVADGMVYVSTYRPDRPGIPPASRRIYALRASNGSIAWSLPLTTSREPGSAKIVAGAGLLVIFAEDGSIAAWHSHNGSAAWHLDSSAFSRSTTETGSQILGDQVAFITDQTIYFARTLSPAPSSLLVALRVSDGQRVWQHDFTENRSIGPIFLSGTHLYLEIYDGLYAFDTTNGALRWQRSDVWASAGVEASGVIYVSGDTAEGVTLKAFRAGDGRELWRYVFASSSYAGTPVVLHNVLFVSLGSKGALLFGNVCPGRSELPVAIFALNASDGSIYWRTPTDTPGLLSLVGTV